MILFSFNAFSSLVEDAMKVTYVYIYRKEGNLEREMLMVDHESELVRKRWCAQHTTIRIHVEVMKRRERQKKKNRNEMKCEGKNVLSEIFTVSAPDG